MLCVRGPSRSAARRGLGASRVRLSPHWEWTHRLDRSNSKPGVCFYVEVSAFFDKLSLAYHRLAISKQIPRNRLDWAMARSAKTLHICAVCCAGFPVVHCNHTVWWFQLVVFAVVSAASLSPISQRFLRTQKHALLFRWHVCYVFVRSFSWGTQAALSLGCLSRVCLERSRLIDIENNRRGTQETPSRPTERNVWISESRTHSTQAMYMR